ncbi:MAG: zf-HC2 domain-containing protein [Chloroflexota bacterium]
MTMPNDSHPRDERLAAYADREADALRDRALTEHLAGCARCQLVLDDLAALRAALAELPDIAPSRPLRLIPPVPAPASRDAGRVGWLRRLTAPVFGAGAGLVLIGAVGASGALSGFSGAASLGAPEGQASADLRPTDAPPATQGSDVEFAGGSGAQEPLASPRVATDGSTGRSPDASPDAVTGADESPPGKSGDPVTAAHDSESVTAFPGFLALLLVGIGLIVVAAVMRFALQPRAG